MSTAPPVILPKRDPAAATDPGCSRWAGLGCSVVIIILAALVFGSFLFFDRGVRWAVHRASSRIEESLDPGVPPDLRERLHGELEDFGVQSARRGAAPRSGAFLERAGKILEDGRVTREEAEALEVFLAGEGSGTEEKNGGRRP